FHQVISPAVTVEPALDSVLQVQTCLSNCRVEEGKLKEFLDSPAKNRKLTARTRTGQQRRGLRSPRISNKNTVVHKLRPNEAGLEALLLVLVFVERAKLHFLQDTLVSLVKRRVQEIGSPKFFATGTLLFVRKIGSLQLFQSLPPETVLHVGTPQFLPPPF